MKNKIQSISISTICISQISYYLLLKSLQYQMKMLEAYISLCSYRKLMNYLLRIIVEMQFQGEIMHQIVSLSRDIYISYMTQSFPNHSNHTEKFIKAVQDKSYYVLINLSHPLRVHAKIFHITQYSFDILLRCRR